jgi:D-serine dehydratase
MNHLENLKEKKPFLWINSKKLPSEEALSIQSLTSDDINDVEQQLKKFGPILVKLFPELSESDGVIDSALIDISQMVSASSIITSSESCKAYIKGDHALRVSGSIKARGGFYAVLVIVEKILRTQSLYVSDLNDFSIDKIRAIFSSSTIIVGSTGNLGLSVGIMGRAFGFSVTVHMSHDAKEWKKNRLRTIGADVIEHKTDYTEVNRFARQTADESKKVYIIDDENSVDLFLGYSVAAKMIAKQIKDENICVDSQHPLFVYLPCGVGGAPGGITFGLKHLFGDNVHCFFAEPVDAPTMMLGLVSGKNGSISVRDIGLSINTCADGLAVGSPSELVANMMSTILDGCFTVKDSDMLLFLAELYNKKDIRIEPSAAAGFAGIEFLCNSKTGKDYLEKRNIEANNITHIVWTTGGSMEPEEEFQKNYKASQINS